MKTHGEIEIKLIFVYIHRTNTKSIYADAIYNFIDNNKYYLYNNFSGEPYGNISYVRHKYFRCKSNDTFPRKY